MAAGAPFGLPFQVNVLTSVDHDRPDIAVHSLDDFVVTFFTAGVGTTTLPMFVFGLLKQRVPPEINAISTVMIVVSIVLVGVSLMLQQRGGRAEET